MDFLIALAAGGAGVPADSMLVPAMGYQLAFDPLYPASPSPGQLRDHPNDPLVTGLPNAAPPVEADVAPQAEARSLSSMNQLDRVAHTSGAATRAASPSSDPGDPLATGLPDAAQPVDADVAPHPEARALSSINQLDRIAHTSGAAIPAASLSSEVRTGGLGSDQPHDVGSAEASAVSRSTFHDAGFPIGAEAGGRSHARASHHVDRTSESARAESLERTPAVAKMAAPESTGWTFQPQPPLVPAGSVGFAGSLAETLGREETNSTAMGLRKGENSVRRATQPAPLPTPPAVITSNSSEVGLSDGNVQHSSSPRQSSARPAGPLQGRSRPAFTAATTRDFAPQDRETQAPSSPPSPPREMDDRLEGRNTPVVALDQPEHLIDPPTPPVPPSHQPMAKMAATAERVPLDENHRASPSPRTMLERTKRELTPGGGILSAGEQHLAVRDVDRPSTEMTPARTLAPARSALIHARRAETAFLPSPDSQFPDSQSGRGRAGTIEIHAAAPEPAPGVASAAPSQGAGGFEAYAGLRRYTGWFRG
jgi:hypothetical protein